MPISSFLRHTVYVRICGPTRRLFAGSLSDSQFKTFTIPGQPRRQPSSSSSSSSHSHCRTSKHQTKNYIVYTGVLSTRTTSKRLTDWSGKKARKGRELRRERKGKWEQVGGSENRIQKNAARWDDEAGMEGGTEGCDTTR